MAASFQELFAGSDLTHGHWLQESGYSTQEGPALEQDYLDHLSGAKGLGLVPVRTDGTCVFGALDIDIDTIDHQALYAAVASRNLPINVCRSKSGAAHGYVFFKTPMQATKVQALLKRWAGLLGFPNCEVFPKQVRIDEKNLGNWINLPYFGGQHSTRACYGAEGSMSLNDFLASVKYYDPKAEVNETSEVKAVDLVQIMPPCLATLTRQGMPEGMRNNGLFNFAIFYRKAYSNGWEDKVREHNQKYVIPPMDRKEIDDIIKSVGKKKYQYRCNEEPICSRCNRAVCQTMQYGVKNMPWDEGGSFDDFVANNLRKIDTRPPRYRLEVNSKDIEMSTDDLRNYQVGFKKRVFEDLNLVLPPMKQEVWDQTLRELLATLTVIEAPADASLNGMILMKIFEFTALSERAKKIEDVLKGIPFRDKDTVIFRSIDLQRYLQSARFTIENQILYQLMMAEGGAYRILDIKGKKTTVWSLPLVAGALQTESFDEPKFDGIGEKL